MQQRSTIASVPAPIGGWNARDPFELMPETDAVELQNLFPDSVDLKLRSGFREHADGMGSGIVKTLFELVGQTGTRKLIACTNSKIYDATTFNSNASDITGTTTPTDDQWQYVIYKGTAILVNGSDQPQQISSAASVSDAAYTGVTDDADFIDVTVYRDRLYFVEKDTSSFWYTNSANNLTGATTEFDLGRIFKNGGYLLWIANWTRESGSGADDLLVCCSNMGEIVIYTGANPGDSSWSLVSRFEIPIPLGIRSKFNVGGDLVVITEQGVIPLSTVLNAGAVASYAAYTDKIQRAFSSVAKYAGSNAGWEGLVYPRGRFIIINVPVNAGATYEQYVMNSLTGAWCKFTGQTAYTWARYDSGLYFGGIDGKVYQADYGTDDAGQAIQARMRQAYSYLGQRGRQKRILMGAPLINASDTITFSYDVDMDFERTSFGAPVTITGSSGTAWDSATWDVSSWGNANVKNDEWYNLCGLGSAVSVKLSANITGVDFTLNANRIIFEAGGYL